MIDLFWTNNIYIIRFQQDLRSNTITQQTLMCNKMCGFEMISSLLKMVVPFVVDLKPLHFEPFYFYLSKNKKNGRRQSDQILSAFFN
jgi:hypothetical protein